MLKVCWGIKDHGASPFQAPSDLSVAVQLWSLSSFADLLSAVDVNGLNAATEQYQNAITANDVKKQIELQSLIKVMFAFRFCSAKTRR
jgi:hypothetical protein